SDFTMKGMDAFWIGMLVVGCVGCRTISTHDLTSVPSEESSAGYADISSEFDGDDRESPGVFTAEWTKAPISGNSRAAAKPAGRPARNAETRGNPPIPGTLADAADEQSDIQLAQLQVNGP